MKDLKSHIIAGISGGMIVILSLLLWQFFNYEEVDKEVSSRENPSYVEVKGNSEIVSYPVNKSFSDIVKKSINSVVHIRAEESKESHEERLKKRSGPLDFWSMDNFIQPRKREGVGSGVIVSESGFIITNYHVVKFGDYITVTLKNGNRYRAEKVGIDPKADLALLKIEADDLEKIDYADSDMTEVGDWVIAIGNPFDELTSTVTAGIVSAKGRNLNLRSGPTHLESFIQTDAAINPGNSGGALLDSKGKLLGINTAIYTPTGVYAGYSFAIPSNQVRDIIEAMLEEGIVKRASLGVSITENDSLLKEEYNLETSEGWVILEIVQGSSAQYAGLHPFDVVLEVEGEKLTNEKQLLNLMNKKRVGDTITLTVQRKDKRKKLDISLRK